MIIRELLIEEVNDFKSDILSDQFLADALNEADLTSTRIFTAIVDNEVVGYIAYDKYTLSSSCICFFYIKPQYRRKGYGKQLLRKLTEKLKKHNSCIYGFVNIYNKPAYNFYKKYYQFYGNITEHDEVEVIFYLEERRFYNERSND